MATSCHVGHALRCDARSLSQLAECHGTVATWRHPGGGFGQCTAGFPKGHARSRSRDGRIAFRFAGGPAQFSYHNASVECLRPRSCHVAPPIFTAAVHSHGSGCSSSSCYLRERRQSPAGAREGSSERYRGETHGWREKAALDSPAYYRECSARRLWWCPRTAVRFLGLQVATNLDGARALSDFDQCTAGCEGSRLHVPDFFGYCPAVWLGSCLASGTP